MDGKTIVASVVVGILGLLSTGVGLAFELLPFNAQVRATRGFNYGLIFFEDTENLLINSCTIFKRKINHFVG